jgi:hypothetical protein
MKNLPSRALGFTLGVIIGLIAIPPLTASPDVNRAVLAQSTMSSDDVGFSNAGATKLFLPDIGSPCSHDRRHGQ